MMKIYDISLPIKPTMPVWPGDPPVSIRSLSKIEEGDDAAVTEIQMSVHTGTHIDAASHFIEDGQTIDQIPLEKLFGEVLIINIDQIEKCISERVLKKHPLNNELINAKKVLFKTKNSRFWHDFPEEFQTDYVGIDASGATYLSKLNLDLVGVDYLSIAPFAETKQPHQILLTNEIVLLEGINLISIPEGKYQLYCLPLKIKGCEGAPARVVLVDPF
ncbi:MAG: cyclase family protein [Chloroflexota bacterium]|nr:cyclase family protein [Chloroflexota bacterium]